MPTRGTHAFTLVVGVARLARPRTVGVARVLHSRRFRFGWLGPALSSESSLDPAPSESSESLESLGWLDQSPDWLGPAPSPGCSQCGLKLKSRANSASRFGLGPCSSNISSFSP
jgi:hypothetical protein